MPELDERSNSTAVGYNLVPPPGWDHIPLRSDSTNDAILKIIDRSIKNLPQNLPKDDVSKARMELFKQLKQVSQQAAEANGLMLYLPVERIYGTYVPASFVISAPIAGAGEGVDADEVMSLLAAGRGNNESVDVDGSEGKRIERIVPPPDDSEVQYPSRRVEYVLPIPGNPTAGWLTIAFSTVGDGNPESEFSEALVDVFDAVMTTFRWSYA